MRRAAVIGLADCAGFAAVIGWIHVVCLGKDGDPTFGSLVWW